MNPAEWLKRRASLAPEAGAIWRGERKIATYEEFASAAAGIAAGLTARGIGPGARVGVFMGNAPAYLEALYGIWWAGAMAVPINAKLHAKEAAWILDDAQAAMVFTDAAHMPDLMPELPAGCVVIDAESAAFEDLKASLAPDAPQQLAPEDPIWLFYTSGTTGRPKGVVISCGSVSAMCFSYLADVDQVLSEDRILYAAPMSHGAGIYNFLHVLRGTGHVIPDSGGFDPAEILSLAHYHGSLTMFAAPTMVRRLVDVAKARGETGEGIRTIIYAGGPMYEADILDAVEVMGPRFVQIYGQGECPMGITALPRDAVADRSHPRWRDRLNSVGSAQSAVEVRIVDEEGATVAEGETGEIVVRGATVMSGYWRNPEATAKTLRDGWLWTGDMGRMDAEGYVTLVDRSKDMIISGGSNIYPREVEEVLLGHPEVREVAVVGRPHADWGEEVVAYVVGKAEESELDQLCLDRIARFKRPKAYVFVEDLPKNNYGKVLKTDLRARFDGSE